MSRPKSNTPRKIRLSVTIDADQMRWLKAEAKRQRIDLSALIRKMINNTNVWTVSNG